MSDNVTIAVTARDVPLRALITGLMFYRITAHSVTFSGIVFSPSSGNR